MKIRALSLTLLLVPTLAFGESAAQKANSFYKQGLAAEKQGDPAAALIAYESALKAYPQHPHARYRAGQVKIHGGKMKAATREAKVGAIMIPVYQLEDASFKEAVDLLSKAIEVATEGEVAPNFVIKDTKNAFDQTNITMNLKNIPVKGIINYLTDVTGMKTRYDEHAIVFQSR